jgi:RHS repeat-associated protein
VKICAIAEVFPNRDASGNLLAEQDGPFADPAAEPADVTDLGGGIYVSGHGWGLTHPDPDAGIRNLTRRTYTWNERNLLKSSSDGRYNVAYTYGQDGERSGKYSSATSGGRPTETLYFNKMWAWRYDGMINDSTGRYRKHIYLNESRIVTKIARADGSFTNEERIKQYYYHSDHLGSAQLISNADGEEYERIEYTPYGELWIEKASTASNIDIPFRFTGKERDEETGLYYYGARYLDSKTSRWLSTDPALGDYIPGVPINDEAKKHNQQLPGQGGIFNTINSHLYHYAGNNPVKYTDPDGRRFSLASIWKAATKWHYEKRDARNEMTEPIEDIQKGKDGWEVEPRDAFHQGGENGHNTKYTNPDGREIVINDKTGEVVTDSATRGTYNYVDPGKKPDEWHDIGGWVVYGVRAIGHFFADVLPYLFLGNDRPSNKNTGGDN